MKEKFKNALNMHTTNEKGRGIRRQLEIDFVCNKEYKRYYIQTAYAVIWEFCRNLNIWNRDVDWVDIVCPIWLSRHIN